jgi:hypothetical protein
VDSRKLITATIFGVVIGIAYGPVPFEIGDSLIVFQAIMLSLSFILLGRGGATYTALVSGLIQTPFQLGFGAFALLAAVLYGVLIDLFCSLLKVNSGDRVSTKRLVAALSISTTIVGLVATFAFIALGFGTTAPLLDLYLPIVVVGVISGVIGAFLAARIWERVLKARFRTSQPPAG